MFSNCTISTIQTSDIQEFYETTLLDDTKTPEQKAEETEEAVQRWANNSSPVESPPPSYSDFDKASSGNFTYILERFYVGRHIFSWQLSGNQITCG